MNIDTNEFEAKNNSANQHFEPRVTDQYAFIAYRRHENQVAFIHKDVPAALEGYGIGSVRAQAGLEYAKDENLGVVPLCPFVGGYIGKNPQYRPLVSKNYRRGGL